MTLDFLPGGFASAFGVGKSSELHLQLRWTSICDKYVCVLHTWYLMCRLHPCNSKVGVNVLLLIKRWAVGGFPKLLSGVRKQKGLWTPVLGQPPFPGDKVLGLGGVLHVACVMNVLKMQGDRTGVLDGTWG